jgi:hypothetical protein
MLGVEDGRRAYSHVCNAAAPDIGIPEELAKYYFMQLLDGLVSE